MDKLFTEPAGALLKTWCNLHTPVMQLGDNPATRHLVEWNPPFLLFLQTLFTVRFTQNSLVIILLSANYTLLGLSCMHTGQCREIPSCKHQNPIPNLQLYNSTRWVRSNTERENSYRITKSQFFLYFSPIHWGEKQIWVELLLIWCS